MRIRNTMTYPEVPDYMLRRIIGWTCKKLGLRVKDVHGLLFPGAVQAQAHAARESTS